MFFRKVCTKTYAVYSYFSYFSKKYGHMNSIILMKKIPLTDRVISKNNLEFFFDFINFYLKYILVMIFQKTCNQHLKNISELKFYF